MKIFNSRFFFNFKETEYFELSLFFHYIAIITLTCVLYIYIILSQKTIILQYSEAGLKPLLC